MVAKAHAVSDADNADGDPMRAAFARLPKPKGPACIVWRVAATEEETRAIFAAVALLSPEQAALAAKDGIRSSPTELGRCLAAICKAWVDARP